MGQEDQGLKAVISGSFFPGRLGWGGLELACIFSLLLCGHRMHRHKHAQGDRHTHRPAECACQARGHRQGQSPKHTCRNAHTSL